MSSGGARTATAVILMTMVFAPVAQKNGWAYKLVGKRQSSPVMVQCAPGDTCPEQKTLVERLYLPKPKQPLTPPRATKPVAKPKAKKPVAKPKAKKPVAKPKAKKPVSRPKLTVIVTPSKQK